MQEDRTSDASTKTCGLQKKRNHHSSLGNQTLVHVLEEQAYHFKAIIHRPDSPVRSNRPDKVWSRTCPSIQVCRCSPRRCDRTLHRSHTGTAACTQVRTFHSHILRKEAQLKKTSLKGERKLASHFKWRECYWSRPRFCSAFASLSVGTELHTLKFHFNFRKSISNICPAFSFPRQVNIESLFVCSFSTDNGIGLTAMDLRWSQPLPRHPGAHRHSPVTGSHSALFLHSQRCLQLLPYIPGGHAGEAQEKRSPT